MLENQHRDRCCRTEQIHGPPCVGLLKKARPQTIRAHADGARQEGQCAALRVVGMVAWQIVVRRAVIPMMMLPFHSGAAAIPREISTRFHAGEAPRHLSFSGAIQMHKISICCIVFFKICFCNLRGNISKIYRNISHNWIIKILAKFEWHRRTIEQHSATITWNDAHE